jgi:uncharacterized protein
MDKLALVTGASAGIGFHLAHQLAERGYDIVGVGASDRVNTLPQRIPDVEVVPVAVDLSTADGVDQLWQRVESLGRPLDIAALNAGVSLCGAFLDTPIEAELTMIGLNITSQVLLAKRIVSAMVKRRHGRP